MEAEKTEKNIKIFYDLMMKQLPEITFSEILLIIIKYF